MSARTRVYLGDKIILFAVVLIKTDERISFGKVNELLKDEFFNRDSSVNS